MDQINPVINAGNTSATAGSGATAPSNNGSGGSSASSSGGGGSVGGSSASAGGSESGGVGSGGGGGGLNGSSNPLDLLHSTSVDVLQQLQQQVLKENLI